MDCSPLHTSHVNITHHIMVVIIIIKVRGRRSIRSFIRFCLSGFAQLHENIFFPPRCIRPFADPHSDIPRFLTQNMQERQTHVLALPARAEGRDRETEGILKKKYTKYVPPLGSSGLTEEIRSNSRNSHRLCAGFGDTEPCQTCEVHGGWGRECCSRLLSLMASVLLPHLSSLPLLLACSLWVLHSCSSTLSFVHSLTSAFLYNCGNFIP